MSVTPLPSTLAVGGVITVKGSTNPDCEGFSINLCTGSDLSEDTPFHFNPRFCQEEVVRNTLSGDWGEEEKEGGFPFTKDSAYEVQIVVKQDHYQVYPIPFPLSDGADIIVKGVVNNEPHRFSINLGSGTDVSGDVLLHFNPRFDQNEVVRNHNQDGWGEEEKEGDFPFAAGAPYELKFVVKDKYIESIPVCTPIKGGFAPGASVSVTGKINSNPERFSVNLVCGPDGESCDLALHFDVRLNYGDTPNYTVRTHRADGEFYGEEERGESFFPFEPEGDFSIKIAAENDCFQIYVNEQHYSTFSYRIQPVQKVDHIMIQGDVEISQICFE
ncbi:galectin [Elysia marginata]|uniref:Galectin n=1 Tax=Elysia marginata TaxID=1093978 RepID=A0AAV4FU24_9GAST|nr:galectin [Elysia marginata]